MLQCIEGFSIAPVVVRGLSNLLHENGPALDVSILPMGDDFRSAVAEDSFFPANGLALQRPITLTLF